MRQLSLLGVFGLASVVLVAGCARTDDPAPNKSPDPKASAEAKARYLLASEPSDAKGVKEVKQNAKNGDEVVVVGRIGGSTTPFTGRGAFTIVDLSFKPCSEVEGDNCSTPWDYCCTAPDDLAKGTVLVKLVDAAGKTLQDDAKEVLSLRELQTVVVRGQTRRDEPNSISVLAAGIFVRK
jgi:hypothetical protein